ncbi:cupin domain-containing protein [Nitratifractor sp.]
MKNLYDYAVPQNGESFETLFEHPQARIVRIVSSEHPDSSLYDQEEDEWVVLLEGKATLEVRGEKVQMKRGDTLFLPAHTPHRVLKTSSGALWLALHFRKDQS